MAPPDTPGLQVASPDTRGLQVALPDTLGLQMAPPRICLTGGATPFHMVTVQHTKYSTRSFLTVPR